MDVGGEMLELCVVKDFDVSEILDLLFGWNLFNWLLCCEMVVCLVEFLIVDFWVGIGFDCMVVCEVEVFVILMDGIYICVKLVIGVDGWNSVVCKVVGIDVYII